MTGWKPTPPQWWEVRKQRAGVDAVLALIDEHRDTAARFAVHAAEADAKAARLRRHGRWIKARRERDRAARASRTARERIGAADCIIEALLDPWGQWDEYVAAADDEDREGT